MTAATLLTPLKSAGYSLSAPPRAGIWNIEPGVSSLELRVREPHRTSVLEAGIIDGEVHLTDTAGSSRIWLLLGPALTRRASGRSIQWMHAAGLDSTSHPIRFDSRVMLAAPRGWRMCGQLRAAHLDTMLIADARVGSVRTRPDGHDGMAMTASGTINRRRLGEMRDAFLASRVAVRLHAYLIHD